MKKGRRSGAPSRGGEKKRKLQNERRKRKIIKTIWNLCAYFISFGFGNAGGSQQASPQGSNVGDLRGVLGVRRRNILGNVLYGVLSFSSWFSCSFIYFSSSSFFRYSLDAICSAHRYMYIHTYVYGISIGMCVCKPEAAVKWEWLLFFVFSFFNPFLVERKLKQFECTLSAPNWCDFTHDIVQIYRTWVSNGGIGRV